MLREDELDIRPHVVAVVRHWKVVAAVTVLAAAIGAMSGLATQPGFEATASVAIAAPGVQPVPATKTYIDLALGDKVLTALAQGLGSGSSKIPLSAADLRPKCRVYQGAEPNQVVFRVRDTDPRRASEIANAWAATFAQVARSTFDTSDVGLRQIDAQLRLAQDQLHQAETALLAEEKQDSYFVLQTQLDALKKSLTDLYSYRAELSASAEQAERLLARLRQFDQNRLSGPGEDFAILQLQLRLLSGPVELQLPGSLATSGLTIADQVAQVKQLASIIADRTRETENQIALQQSSVLDLQAKHEQSTNHEAVFVAQRDNARQAIKDLAAKGTQLRLTAEAGTNRPRVLEDATQVETLPSATTKNASIGLGLGLVVGLVAALGFEHTKSGRRAAKPNAAPHLQ